MSKTILVIAFLLVGSTAMAGDCLGGRCLVRSREVVKSIVSVPTKVVNCCKNGVCKVKTRVVNVIR
jgi:hypothetical protein